MNIFDYSAQGRRPTAKQVVSDWKKAGRPAMFQVEYGETFAQFESVVSVQWSGGTTARWYGSGNGCRGVNREAVVKWLNAWEPTHV